LICNTSNIYIKITKKVYSKKIKTSEFKKLIREEVGNVLKEAPGQIRDNSDNVNALVSLFRRPGINKEVKLELTELLSEPEHRKFAQDFDNMISNFIDEALPRGI
jgi:hypothetical protein